MYKIFCSYDHAEFVFILFVIYTQFDWPIDIINIDWLLIVLHQPPKVLFNAEMEDKLYLLLFLTEAIEYEWDYFIIKHDMNI